jgi:hypothetical protein
LAQRRKRGRSARRTTLCYYRVTSAANPCHDGRDALEDVRELARSSSVPDLLATDTRAPWTSCTYEIRGRRRDLADLGDR